MQPCKFQFCVLVSLLYFSPVYFNLANAEIITVRPLELFFSTNSTSLGLGFPVLISEYPEIYKPAELTVFNTRLSTAYNRESTINEKKTKQNSNTTNLFALSSFNLPYLNHSSFGFLINKFKSTNYFDDKNNILQVNQHITDSAFAFSIVPNNTVSLGIGLEHDLGHSHGFYQIKINALRYMSVGYRQFNRTLQMNASYMSDDNSALFNIAGSENVKELNVALDNSAVYRFKLAFELEQSKNIRADLSLYPKSPISFNYQYKGVKYEYFNNISIDGNPGGTISSKFNQSTHQFLVSYRPDNRQRFYVNFRRVKAQPGVAGKIDSQYTLNFWENLLFGERDYDAQYTIKINQFNLAMEDAVSERFRLRGGIQYLYLTPSGELEHWTPSPVIGVGKFDTNVIPLPYKNASFLGLSFGFTYRIKKIELSYGLSQLIPIRIEKTEGTATTTPVSHGHIDLDNLWKELQKDHGGNMQQLELTWHL